MSRCTCGSATGQSNWYCPIHNRKDTTPMSQSETRPPDTECQICGALKAPLARACSRCDADLRAGEGDAAAGRVQSSEEVFAELDKEFALHPSPPIDYATWLDFACDKMRPPRRWEEPDKKHATRMAYARNAARRELAALRAKLAAAREALEKIAERYKEPEWLRLTAVVVARAALTAIDKEQA